MVDAAARRATCRPRRSSAGATARCSSLDEIQTGLGRTGTLVRARALGPRARLRARRQGAQRRLHAGRRDGHARARSSSARSARSSAPTCTSRPTGATACRWRRASRRCASSSATASSSTPRASGALLRRRARRAAAAPRDGRGGPRQRADDRDRAAARRARASRGSNWRLIHMASEGLFPQLIVIPLHRDHGVITMAAGKNDVIKLLPPLTLSRGRGAAASSTRSTPCSPTATAPRARTGAWCATSPPRRCGAAASAERGRGRRDAVPRQAGRPVARRRLPGHGRDRVHRRAPRAAAGAARATRCAASCARAATRRCSTGSTSRSPSATSTERALARPRRGGLPLRAPLRRAGLGLGHRGGDRRASTSRARATCSRRRAGASVQRFVHFSTHRRLRLPGRRRDRRDLRRDALSQLVRADQARRPSARSAARRRRTRSTP